MEIASLRKVIKERLDEIDEYMNNIPKVEVLPWEKQSSRELVGREYTRVVDLGTKLNRIILASEYLQSVITEAISLLSGNLEIEQKQKQMLKNALELLQVRTKPLYNEKPLYVKLEIFYQRLYRDF